MGRWKQRLEWCSHKSRSPWGHESWMWDKERMVPWSLQRSTALLIPWFHTSSLQNYERINYFILCHPGYASLYGSPKKLVNPQKRFSSSPYANWVKPPPLGPAHSPLVDNCHAPLLWKRGNEQCPPLCGGITAVRSTIGPSPVFPTATRGPVREERQAVMLIGDHLWKQPTWRKLSMPSIIYMLSVH